MRALTAAANAGLIPSSSASSQHDHFVLQTGEELARALQTQELGRPLALGSVIDEAVRKKELTPLKEFLEAKESIYAKHWLPTPWQVMSWGLRQLGVIGGDSSEDKLVRGEFVIMANLEASDKDTSCRPIGLTGNRQQQRQRSITSPKQPAPTQLASFLGIFSPLRFAMHSMSPLSAKGIPPFY